MKMRKCQEMKRLKVNMLSFPRKKAGDHHTPLAKASGDGFPANEDCGCHARQEGSCPPGEKVVATPAEAAATPGMKGGAPGRALAAATPATGAQSGRMPTREKRTWGGCQEEEKPVKKAPGKQETETTRQKAAPAAETHEWKMRTSPSAWCLCREPELQQVPASATLLPDTSLL